MMSMTSLGQITHVKIMDFLNMVPWNSAER